MGNFLANGQQSPWHIPGARNAPVEVKPTPEPQEKGEDSRFVKKVVAYRDQKDYFKMNEKIMGMGFATRAIHAGCEPDPVHGGVNPAIELSSTFA